MTKRKFNKLIGARLKFIRMLHGQSQESISFLLELDQSALSRIEQGRQNITLFQLTVFCKHFDVPVGEMFP